MGHESIDPVWFPDFTTFEGLDLVDLASTRVTTSVVIFNRLLLAYQLRLTDCSH